jgi:FixJ family two-component response regulator
MIFNRIVSGSSSSISIATSTVVVVDADFSIGKSLEPLIRGAGWRTRTFTSAEEFLAMPRLLGPACLVLDLASPNLGGLELQKRVADRVEIPVILLGCHGDVPLIVQAMKAGAFDFFTKPFDPHALMGAIERALARSDSALRQEAEHQVLRERYESLSTREREVMSLVVSGLLNKIVGAELGISEITVKQHRGKAMRKMRARSLPDLVYMAVKLRLGIVPENIAAPEGTSHSPKAKDFILQHNPADDALSSRFSSKNAGKVLVSSRVRNSPGTVSDHA